MNSRVSPDPDRDSLEFSRCERSAQSLPAVPPQ
jgi:hypothetical protein